MATQNYATVPSRNVSVSAPASRSRKVPSKVPIIASAMRAQVGPRRIAKQFKT